MHANRQQRETGPRLAKVLILIILVSGCIWVGVKIFQKSKPNIDETPNPSIATDEQLRTSSDYDIANEELSKKLIALAKEDPRIIKVLEDASSYPEEVLVLLSKNPEARDFVLGYTKNKDGSSSGKLNKSELSADVPRLYQWDERWGYVNYGSSVIGVTGCGPTCLSMIVIGLTGKKDATPAEIATFSEENGYYVIGGGTSWDLMTTGAQSFGLVGTVLPLHEDSMIASLNNGNPLIINVGPGDFTDFGHYLVITAYKDGKFIINDPNSPDKSSKSWDYETLSPQILNIWSYSLA